MRWYHRAEILTAIIIAIANTALVLVAVYSAKISREHLDKVSEQIDLQYHRKVFNVKASFFYMGAGQGRYASRANYADRLITLDIAFLNGGNQYVLVQKMQLCFSDTSGTNFKWRTDWWVDDDGKPAGPIVVEPHEIVSRAIVFKYPGREMFQWLGANKADVQQYLNAKMELLVVDSDGKEYEISSSPRSYCIRNGELVYWLVGREQITLIE